MDSLHYAFKDLSEQDQQLVLDYYKVQKPTNTMLRKWYSESYDSSSISLEFIRLEMKVRELENHIVKMSLDVYT